MYAQQVVALAQQVGADRLDTISEDSASEGQQAIECSRHKTNAWAHS